MDIVALRYFTETARLGNLTKAAEKLEISPSAVYRQIKILETELGVSLYYRTHYGLSLTSAGKALYDKAVEILQLSDAAIRDITNSRYEIKEPLAIAFMDGSFSCDAADILDSFKKENPQIQINLFNGVHVNILSMLRNKTVDIGCLFYYQKPKGLQYIKTNVTKPLGILMRADDELADKEILASMLRELPLIVPQTEDFNPDRISGLPYDPFGDNIIAVTSNTYTFWELVMNKQAYIYCIEPGPLLLNGSDMIFKPVSPVKNVSLFFVRQEHPVHDESSRAFFEYLRSKYDQ